MALREVRVGLGTRKLTDEMTNSITDKRFPTSGELGKGQRRQTAAEEQKDCKCEIKRQLFLQLLIIMSLLT